MTALRSLLAARLPPAIEELHAYLPDATKVDVRLDANEAPSILPTLRDDERAAWRHALESIEPARYPDVRANALREAIATYAKTTGDRIVLGVGSDEVIAMLLATLGRSIDGEKPLVLVPSPTFVMYRISARVHGYDVAEVPLDARADLDEGKLGEAIAKLRPAVLFLAAPNNPTSRAFDRGKVERLIELAGRGDPPTAVVVDEAYLHYRMTKDDPWGGVTGVDLLERHPHVVVLRTLSKVGFAALRVGWAIARPELATEMDKVRLPYNLPSPSQVGGQVALTVLASAIDRHVRAVVEERARLTQELSAMEAVSFPRADANFLFLKVRDAARVAAQMKERGVLVRANAAWGDHLRVTVGSASENDRFLDALRATVAA